MAVQAPDFTAYVQRAKDLNLHGIFVMIPGGAQPAAFGKALAEVGVDPKKTEILGQLEIADERALASMGDIAEGIITSGHYDLQPSVEAERGIRESRQCRLQAQSRLFLDRLLIRHAPDRHRVGRNPAARPTAKR